MDWVDRPKNYKGLYGILQLLQGSHLDNFPQKTLKLGRVAFHSLTFRFYSADTRTMNAMALFLLYLYFFFTYFNIFSQLANHSLESMQRSRLFPAFFPRYFQSGAMISNNGGDIFPISFSNFLSITVVSLLYKSGILYQ